MTAKKKRKKLINCIYHGVPRDPVVHLSERCALIIPPPWPKPPSVVFDASPDPEVEEPGGDVSIKTVTTSTVSHGLDGSVIEDFFVTEEKIDNLSPSFEKFVASMFGVSWRNEVV